MVLAMNRHESEDADQELSTRPRVIEGEGAGRDAYRQELQPPSCCALHQSFGAARRSGRAARAERRRVEIARALATHPSYILLDEPLAGIDPIAVGEIRDLVVHLKDRGIGVLITDHNVRDALDIIDRAYILHDGQVLKEGTPSEIVSDRDVRRVYLGEKFTL